MKGMEMAEITMDKLLDFSLDVEDDNEDIEIAGQLLRHPSSSVPEQTLEEDLEWLSNVDSFPTVESLMDIIPYEDTLVKSSSKHRSPISVLEATNGNTPVSSSSALASCLLGCNFPVKARSKLCRRRRDGLEQSWSCPFIPEKKKGIVLKSSGISGRKCLHCQSDRTPQWRAGPDGPKTLCNACGVRYKSGRLVPEYRPASSPSFSSEVHSNSHRKIMEMRRGKEAEMGCRY